MPTSRVNGLASAGRQFVLLAGILALTQSPMTYAQKFEEGVHYHVLPQAQPVQTGEQIEVLELFWYHCPHCFALEPVLEEWIQNEKPQNADYVRMPGIANKSWIFDARVFYALEALGLLDQMHADVFNEIHVRKNPFKELSDLRLLLEKHGVSETEFAAAFNSFAVDMKTKNAQKMMMRYQATGVPTIVVDGKYRASASTAGGHRELIELTNYLVDKAAAERR